MTESIDPRRLNQVFSGEGVSQYLQEYGRAVTESLSQLDPGSLEQAFNLIYGSVKAGRRVYVAGNGGSASISEHLCCDLTKGTHVIGKQAIKTHSLVSNVAFFTALGNDYGYENTISTQVKMYGEPGDVLILISSSGNSPNIIAAAEAARQIGMKTIGFCGFSGGKLKECADVSVYIKFSNYGVVEDCHQIVMHCLAQTIAKIQDRK